MRQHLARQPVALGLAVLAVGALVTAQIVVTNALLEVPYDHLLRDPNAIARQPWYFGLVSSLGAGVWLVAATVALVAATLARDTASDGTADLLRTGGLVTALLALDDLLMLHDGLLDTLGVPEPVYALVYPALVAGMVWRHRATILHTDWLLLVAAVGCLALSVAIDVVPGRLALKDLAEETAKLLGILFWSAYFIGLGWRELRRVAAPRRPEGAAGAAATERRAIARPS